MKYFIGEYCFMKLAPQMCLLIITAGYSGIKQTLICYKINGALPYQLLRAKL